MKCFKHELTIKTLWVPINNGHNKINGARVACASLCLLKGKLNFKIFIKNMLFLKLRTVLQIERLTTVFFILLDITVTNTIMCDSKTVNKKFNNTQ